MKKIILLGLFLIAPITVNAAVVDLTAKTNTNLNPVELFLTAGTYSVNPFAGIFTSWNAWSATSGCNGAGENCSKGWINSYSFETPETGVNFISNLSRYATPELALLNAISTTFTLLSDATVKFFIRDTNYKDNTGGMSLNVSAISAVPLPAAIFLLAPALLAFMGFRRNTKNVLA
ncbi:hypothetical protein LCGC14_0635610 [marine sediment metagenome]|uniref:Uncharacterized protein n=1 Tax=marine sediment metagenome TaxID=412755 RepID=A0A0F9TM28_9ZZZZ|nr:hypothetical protein [Methylophaga sp.]HEC59262.1 hypothetical protein [Methylophaga sp.]